MMITHDQTDFIDYPTAIANAKLLWKDRVARLGSLIQLGFAAFWLARGTWATEWALRLPAAAILATAVVAMGVWVERSTRSLVPPSRGFAAQQLGREITIATVLQLAASFALPEIVMVLGRPDLVVGSVSVTIGILLLWLYVELKTPRGWVSGLLLLVIPVGLAFFLQGDNLTAATGLIVGAILLSSASEGVLSLLSRHQTG
jgi:hypothetical protein